MNQINLDINKSGQIINEPVVLRVGEKDQTITVNLLKDGQPYTSFTTATFFANKPSGAIVANDPANISNGVITYTVPQALVSEFGKITNAYFLIDGKVSTENFVIAVLQGVNISDDLNDYIPGMDQLNVIYDKWKAKLQTITDEIAGIDAPKEVKNVIDNELKNYTNQINELQRRITDTEAQLNALKVPEIGGRNYLLGTELPLTVKGANITNQNIGSGYNLSVGNATELFKNSLNFTLSYDWSATSDATGDFQMQFNNTPWIIPGNTNITVDKNHLSGHISCSFIESKIVTQEGKGLATSICPRLDNFTGAITISKAKLEIGNVPTDWTPAPEDVQTAITNALSDVKTQIQDSAVGTNLLLKTYEPFSITGSNVFNQSQQIYALSRRLEAGTTITLSFDVVSTALANFTIQNNGSDGGTWMSYIVSTVDTTKKHNVATIKLSGFSKQGVYIKLDNVPSTTTITISNMKLELGSHATDYSLNPLDITNALGKVDVGKTITATDDTGKTVKLKITGIS